MLDGLLLRIKELLPGISLIPNIILIVIILSLLAVLLHSGYQVNKISLLGSELDLVPPTRLTQEAKPLSNGGNLSINITNPKPYDLIGHPCTVSGYFSGKLPEGWHAWLLSSYIGSPFRWEPQAEITPPLTGSWEEDAYIGGAVETPGTKYEAAVVLVNDVWNEYFRYYQKYVKYSNYTCFVGAPIPDNFPIEARVIVIRK